MVEVVVGVVMVNVEGVVVVLVLGEVSWLEVVVGVEVVVDVVVGVGVEGLSMVDVWLVVVVELEVVVAVAVEASAAISAIASRKMSLRFLVVGVLLRGGFQLPRWRRLSALWWVGTKSALEVS